MLRALCRKFPVLEPLCESRCVSCSRPIPLQPDRCTERTVCPSCSKALARRTVGFCSRCGDITTSAHALPSPCGTCLKQPPEWDGFFFHGVYQGLLRDLILRFKQGHELALGDVLGSFLAMHPEITGEYDAIVPMPLHPSRLRERGFNQALEAARPLAAKYGLPLEAEKLFRIGNTPPQAGLSLKERKENVRGMFATADVSGLRLLLVDDIATTGASLESAVKALLRAGASSVAVAVIARTPMTETD